ncbi:MAG: large-conductance mechanosensitive channel protein MscL [Flavobacteriales bacterium]|nr:large-conductance mechanosensitive channel protein MscL [Flavobacteriales bacterium]MCB9448291.1 large-conductance mechanosensitive channel protein MscL [Flavobacteriales bacterium]
MGFLKEFRTFAVKGNVMDMAVGVIIGGAFGKIIASAVNDIIMPPLGLAIGGMNFRELKLVLKDAYTDAGGQEVAAVTLNYGNFFQTALDFTIIALAIFLMVKAMNQLKKKEEAAPAAPPAPSKEEMLLTDIRDLLKEGRSK